MSEVTSHRGPVADVNHKLVIRAVDEKSSGGAHHCYTICAAADIPSRAYDQAVNDNGGSLAVIIPFHKVGPDAPDELNGVTHEALLAIVAHRLESFQAGAYPCRENKMALLEIKSALTWLHRRTAARAKQGVEGKLMPHQTGRIVLDRLKDRVTVDGGREGGYVPLVSLERLWSPWQLLESLVKPLLPLTEDEMKVIEGIPETTDARRGLTEFKSAIARMA